MKFLYSSFIKTYLFGIRIASLWNKKAKLWINGRNNWEDSLTSIPSSAKVIWFHCSSLGEFEQGLPVIEKVKEKKENNFILLTFFSPSGYEVRKNTTHADLTCYLPMDTTENASRFLDLIHPEMAFFVKYDFWYNYMAELRNREIPTYLISGLFRSSQYFFKPYGFWFKNQLATFNYFFVQNEASLNLLKKVGYNNVLISGDTRFDRVLNVLSNPTKFEIFEQNKDERSCIIVGSNWPEDDEILIPFINSNLSSFQLIIAPHNMDTEQMHKLQKRIKGVVLNLSEIDKNHLPDWDVVIIDSIGKLSSIYQYGDLAFIGGGFGKNVHNILEAATYGLPTIFGPNYKKFQECKDLIKLGGSWSITNTKELSDCIKRFEDKAFYTNASQIASNYVKINSGATDKIISEVFPE